MTLMNQELICIDLDRVRELICRARGHWPKISRETGLSYHWIQAVAQGRIRDPGIQRIRRLLEHPIIRDQMGVWEDEGP